MRRPLRIGLIMQGGHNWMGGVEYMKNIVFALASLPPEVRSTFEVCLICSEELKPVASELSTFVSSTHFFDASQEPLTVPNLIRWGSTKILFGQADLRLDGALNQAKIDFAYPYFAAARWRKHFRSATWIPDCQHKYLTQFFTEAEIQMRDRQFSLTANHASVIVFSSKTAEADFKEFFFKATYKSEILSPCVYPLPEWYESDPVRTQEVYHLPERFFLINNQFWQHKNHLVAFNALKLLGDQAIHPVLVCTGSLYDYRNPLFLNTTLQTINKLGITHQVYLLGIVTRLEMISLMRRALAVIQPSLFEGWNFAVEEARCLGKPIVLSDIPVHREQDPPHSIFFENNSAEHLAMVLADAWKSLTPGPNREHEDIARNSNLKEAQAFGYRFLEIVKG